MSQIGNPWIKLKDFEQTTYWITAKNTFSGVPIHKNGPLEMCQASETEIMLKVPVQSCSVDHHLTIQIDKRRKKAFQEELDENEPFDPEKQLIFTAKITESEPIDTHFKTITLKLYQVDAAKWKTFLHDFAHKQNQLNAQVKRIRGE